MKSEAEKKEKLGEKLRRGVLVGKSKGPCTPLSSHTHFQDHQYQTVTVSARNLAAALWEFNHYFPLFQMHRASNNNAAAAAGAAAAADPRLRRHHYKAPDISNFLADASPSSPDQVRILFLCFQTLSFLTLIWFIGLLLLL